MNKSGLLPIEEIVQSKIETYFSALNSPSFVIGVSGGADSMALLHILYKLGIDLYVVHVNYQKRGVDSEKDAQLVEQTACDLGYDYEIVNTSPKESGGQNFQLWARDVRYKMYKQKVKDYGANGIITAHHQDDQIETILQKIFRGSGLSSWSGMQIWNGQLFRPLLGVSKNEIETYCRDQSIDYRVDASNLESEFARNFLRNKWLSDLEGHFPGWRKNVLRISEQAGIFANSLQYILDDLSDKNNRIKRSEFLQLEKKLQKSLLIYYLHRQAGNTTVSRRALSELDKLDGLQTGKNIELNEHLKLFRDRDRLEIVERTQQAKVSYKLQKEEVSGPGLIVESFRFEVKLFRQPDFKHYLYLDCEAIGWPLQLRTWQHGDRFRPLGMGGHQSVADHLTNRKISANHKAEALVLEEPGGDIIAVIFPAAENRIPPGTIAESVKCSQATSRCLTIKSISQT